MQHNVADEPLTLFLETLLSAAEQVGPAYFQLPVAGREEPQYRERVYAYELYHLVRSNWPATLGRYSLGGEVDKRGHPLIRGNKLDNAKPDLIVHVPGDMEQNLAVVEIKSSLPTESEVRTDIEKLAAFCNDRLGRYDAGYFLVYGTKEEHVPVVLSRFRDCVALQQEPSRLHLLLHMHPGVRPYLPVRRAV
jgi:hypothetical protein